MNFANPPMLWLLLVFPPALVVFFWWALRDRRRLMTQFIQARLLPGLISGLSLTRQKVRFALITTAVALLIITLARPQWGFTWEESKQKGLDIVVAIDTSKSMLAEDIAPNRLQRAKLAALDLMQQAKSDRLGLVAFAGNAFLQCPMTIDDNAFRQSVESLDVNIIPQGGTALAEAIKTALAAFKEGNNFKVLVLFTDGEDNDEGALAAAEAAAKEGMKIFTVGIGTADGELLRVKDAKGRADYIRDDQGNVVKSRLNESLLQQIAGATDGGFYLPLRGAKTIDTLYEKGLAPLPKTEGQEKLVKRYHERYHWPLAAAILLLLVEMLMPERKRAEESKVQSPKSKVRASVAAALVTLLLLPTVGKASPAGALKDFNAGKFTNALTEYERLLAAQAKLQKPEDLRLHFNAGAAAYRATNYSGAMRHFTAVLSAQDIRLQAKAYYNLGNVHFRLGQQAEDLDKLEESWKEAIKEYEHALTLNKADPDAAFNLAFVKHAVEQVKLMREAALRARAAADQEVRRRNYHRASEIMESLLQQNIAAKPFEEFAKKLKNIDEIATPAR
ncbi:MAG: VWA domain-containing protein [Verrucomicrobia bacterium]|nr:VWA domain-containing protein [Verrucomicrobiota bacterium]